MDPLIGILTGILVATFLQRLETRFFPPRVKLNELEGVTTETFLRIGLSSGGLLVLIVFSARTVIEEYGLIQVLALGVVNLVSFFFAFKAYREKSAAYAIVALSIGIAWNVGALLYLIYLENTGIVKFTAFGVIDKTPPPEMFMTLSVLIFWLAFTLRRAITVKTAKTETD